MATENKLKKNLEGELFKLLLDRAMEQKKLLTIADECGVDRKSLTEFRRTGYLGKEKRKNLRAWFVVNNYLRESTEPASYYRSLLVRLQRGWKWLRENLEISLQEAALHTETPEKDIVEWESSVEPFLTFSQTQKILAKAIEWSDPNLYSGLEGDKLEKQIRFHTDFKRLDNPDKSREAVARINAENSELFNSLLSEHISGKHKFNELEYLVFKLNLNLPDGCGPVVISDFACTNCQKWSPSVGDYCMHCGAKLEKPKQDESLFLVNKPES